MSTSATLMLTMSQPAFSLTLEMLPLDCFSLSTMMINVSSIASGISSIVVNAGGWTCIIERGVRVPPSFPSYIAYVKPVNWAYLLFATALLIGVVWACCKFGKIEGISIVFHIKNLRWGSKRLVHQSTQKQ